MYYSVTPIGSEDSLEHFGVKGMKWGVRRYQNADGSLTAKGKKRYSKGGVAAAGTGALAGLAISKAITASKLAALSVAEKAAYLHVGVPLAPFTPVQGAIILGAMGYGAYRIGRKTISVYKTRKMSQVDIEKGRKKTDEILKKSGKTKASNAPISLLSSDVTKKLGYDSTSKLSDKEQAEFWKVYAEEVTRKK